MGGWPSTVVLDEILVATEPERQRDDGSEVVG